MISYSKLYQVAMLLSMVLAKFLNVSSLLTKRTHFPIPRKYKNARRYLEKSSLTSERLTNAPSPEAANANDCLRNYGTGYHTPVLVSEVIQTLITDRSGIYIDGTLGGGGHCMAILDTLNSAGKLYGLDRDREAIEEATYRLQQYINAGQFATIRTNFADMLSTEALKNMRGIVDGILLDLGVSSHQLDDSSRGFSYKYDGPLDMRMESSSSHFIKSASDICNEMDEIDLGNIIYWYGEERRSRKIARAIVSARPLTTTGELATVISTAVPKLEERKTLSRVFQAIRIAVNNELQSLEKGLEAARFMVKPGGRVVVLSYHSLEDRRVKRILSTGNTSSRAMKDIYGNLIVPWTPLFKKPKVASAAEIEFNPRARSVKMRAAERTQHE